MRLPVFLRAGILTLSAIALPAFAQSAPQPEPITVIGTKPPKKAPDPNEIVCEKQQDTSSRLIVHKVCMTRGEWSEQRRLNRQEIDKAQIQRPM